MIIKQIPEYEVYNVVSRIHNNEDFMDGDISDRLEEYEFFNHESSYLVAALNFKHYDIDEDKVDEIIELIKEFGLETMPKIIIDENGDIIDGAHRAAALAKIKIPTIDILRGTNDKYTPQFKKELIDKDLNIYKISNELGSISIMENAKYSPCKNSVFEFIVDNKYRNLGVGTELLKEAVRQYDELGAQISSAPSLKAFIKCGFYRTDNELNLNDLSAYDFTVFQKAPFLVKNDPMYKNKIKDFNDYFDKGMNILKENSSVFLRREIQSIKVSRKLKNNF